MVLSYLKAINWKQIRKWHSLITNRLDFEKVRRGRGYLPAYTYLLHVWITYENPHEYGNRAPSLSNRLYYCGTNLGFPTISHPKQQHNLGYIHDPGAGYHYAFRVPSESKKTIINAPPKENMIENAY